MNELSDSKPDVWEREDNNVIFVRCVPCRLSPRAEWHGRREKQ
jgi:hypothetical protein